MILFKSKVHFLSNPRHRILSFLMEPYTIKIDTGGSLRGVVANVLYSDIVIVIYEALCFDVAQGRMNGAPNETRTHACRFASQACSYLPTPLLGQDMTHGQFLSGV